MAAHSDVNKVLGGKNLVTDTSVAGVTSIAAANNTLSMKDLEEIIRAAKVVNHEVVLSAGILRIRPTNSAL